MDRHILKAALIAGLPLCLLSIIHFHNCCFIIWPILAGLLAAYLLVRSADSYPKDMDGVLAGLYTGLIGGFCGGILNAIISRILFPLFFYKGIEKIIRAIILTPEQRDYLLNRLDEMSKSFGENAPTLTLIVFLAIFFFGIFSTAGGFIGVRIFRPRRFGKMPQGNWQEGGHGGYGNYPPSRPGPF